MNGTHLAEVADRVASLDVADRHHVEEKGLHVVVQRFVVQEELGQQTEVLAVLFVPLSIHLPHAYLVLPKYKAHTVQVRAESKRLQRQKSSFPYSPVHFVAGWMPPQALLPVPPENLPTFRVPQTVLAQVELRRAAELLGVRALVPHLHFPLSHFNHPRASAVPTFSVVVQFLQLFFLRKRTTLVLGNVRNETRLELTIFSLAIAWASMNSFKS